MIALLRRSKKPLDTASVARRLSLHPNGVRLRLRRLEGRGLVERTTARKEIGRPRALWEITPRAIVEADRPHTGWAMARALARAIPPTPPRLRDIEDAGAQMGSELVEQVGASEGDDPFQALSHALEALGFEPRRTDGEPVRYELMTCPYAEAVRENPKVVCTLHKGIVRGVLESVAPAVKLTRFEPHDPDEAGCLVEVTRVAAMQSPKKAKLKRPG